MPSNKSKYTEEFREQIATRILETGRSATSMAEEMGIDTKKDKQLADEREKIEILKKSLHIFMQPQE